MSHFGLARKDCVGTARNTSSKVWFTVAGGVLSDVYYPTIDNTNIETLQYIVTDGSTFTDLQTRDTTYTVKSLDDSGMSLPDHQHRQERQVHARHRLPHRPTPQQRGDGDTRSKPARGVKNLEVYVRMDATVNGNGGGGDPRPRMRGADDAVIDTSTGAPVPVSIDTDTATNAANRDYADAGLRRAAGRPSVHGGVSSGYAGTASDGLVQLDADRAPGTTYDERHRRQRRPGRPGGRPRQPALHPRPRVRRRPAPSVRRGRPHRLDEVQGVGQALRRRLGGLRPTPRQAGSPSGLDAPRAGRARRHYLPVGNVLKASEDKTFPGAIVASLASPWGQACRAGDPAQTYFGSYREVFARDLYETFTGLLAAGDTATAEDTVRFLFERQQHAGRLHARATAWSTASSRPTRSASSSTRSHTRS